MLTLLKTAIEKLPVIREIVAERDKLLSDLQGDALQAR